eukprot:SAG25_NODE_1623_length_2656_cov_1.888150_3_plen_98_part_00
MSVLPVAGGCIAITKGGVALFDEFSNNWFVMTRYFNPWERAQKKKSKLIPWDPWIGSIKFATVVAACDTTVLLCHRPATVAGIPSAGVLASGRCMER